MGLGSLERGAELVRIGQGEKVVAVLEFAMKAPVFIPVELATREERGGIGIRGLGGGASAESGFIDGQADALAGTGKLGAFDRGGFPIRNLRVEAPYGAAEAGGVPADFSLSGR